MLPPVSSPGSTCAVYDKHQVIRQQGCSSSGPVRLTYCQGNCGDTTSMYVSPSLSPAQPLVSPHPQRALTGQGSEKMWLECGSVGQQGLRVLGRREAGPGRDRKGAVIMTARGLQPD